MSKSYSLSSEKENVFVKLKDVNSYGGAQAWYTEVLNMPEKDATGCASIAATNILLYYSQRKRLNLSNTPPDNVTKVQFIKMASELYERYIKQTLNVKTPFTSQNVSSGVWFIDSFTDGIVKFAKEKNIKLTPYTCNNSMLGGSSFDNAVEFVKKAMQNDYPVLLFAGFNKYAKSLYSKGITSELHYVTITGLKALDNNDYSVIISTWGRRTEIPSFKALWEARSISNVLNFANVSLAYYAPSK